MTELRAYSGAGLWIPAFAGMTAGGASVFPLFSAVLS